MSFGLLNLRGCLTGGLIELRSFDLNVLDPI
jgi:hypothetical protein